MRRLRSSSVAVALLGSMVPSWNARAADPDVATTAAHASARAHFASGVAAFNGQDYRVAAREFDAAYAAEPHPDALWDSAQAWERAQEEARAANRYSLYLDTAPPGAADRDRALAALAQLSARLVRVIIRAPRGAQVDVDGEPALVGTVYAYPGAHELHATVGTSTLRRSISLGAGEVRTVVFTQEEALPPRAPDLRVTPGPDPLTPERAQGISPWFVVAGGVATLAIGGVTTWSALDTVSARDAFVADPTQANLDSGRSRELRTNELLALSGVLGVATAVTALFVHWGGEEHRAQAKLGFGVSSFWVRY